jgi:hypothetical protein
MNPLQSRDPLHFIPLVPFSGQGFFLITRLFFRINSINFKKVFYIFKVLKAGNNVLKAGKARSRIGFSIALK